MSDYKMEYVKTLRDEDMVWIQKDGDDTDIKRLIGIDSALKYGIGDSVVRVNMPTKQNDVLKCDWNKRTFYYIVINSIDEIMTFCYALYPISE
jgi:hypothetical protein